MSIFDRFMPDLANYLEKIRTECNPQATEYMPGVEVFHFRDNVYSFYQKSPGRGGAPWMHLIIGPEKAMLIDTGFGIGDLKGLVESITDKPVYVVNTHFHGDHTLGNFQFDRVYIHKYDVPYLEETINPNAHDRFLESPTDPYFKKEDVVAFKPYEIIPVEDGYRFDLGDGYIMEVAHLPGHAPGGIGIIDDHNRILFSGDALVSTPTLVSGPLRGTANTEWMTVTAFRDKLNDLIEKMDRFDVLYPGHAICDYPAQTVVDMRDACNEIIADPNCQTEIGEGMIGSGTMVKLKVVGYASIAYTDERI